MYFITAFTESDTHVNVYMFTTPPELTVRDNCMFTKNKVFKTTNQYGNDVSSKL